MRVEHLQAALAVWDYAFASARHIFGDATGDPVADRIREALADSGPDGMTRTQLSHLFGRHVSSDRIGQALSQLAAMGVAARQITQTEGRPLEVPETGMPVDDSAELEELHLRWMLDRCTYWGRAFGGLGVLRTDFCEWAIARNEVPCTRASFEALLRNCGLLVADGFVSGVILKEDLEALDYGPGRSSTVPNFCSNRSRTRDGC